MPDLARQILEPLQIDNSIKATAWDSYAQATDEADFYRRFKDLPIPNDAKAKLWDSKYGFAKVPTAPTRPPDRTMENIANMANTVGDVSQAHAIESLGGTTLTKLYEGAGEGLKWLSEKALGEPYSRTREQLPFLKGVETIANFGAVIPKTIDAIYTPLGAALGALPISQFGKAASPHVKTAVAAAFSAPQAEHVRKEALPALAKDVNPKTISDVAEGVTMTGLPFLAARAKPVTEADKLNFMRRHVDRTYPIKAFEDQAGGVPLEKSAWVEARNAQGLAGMIEQDLKPRAEALPKRAEVTFGTSPYGINPLVLPTEKYNQMKRYGQLIEVEKELNIDPKYQNPEGLTRKTVKAAKAQMETIIGPETTAEIQNRLQKIYAEDKALQAELQAVGAVSDEHMANIAARKKKGGIDSYLSLRRAAYVADHMDDGEVLPTGSNAFSVANEKVLPSRNVHSSGSTLEFADPFESMVINVMKTRRLIQQQRVGMKLAAHANDPAFKGMIEPISSGQDPGPGRGTFSLLQNGKKVTYAVPEDVAAVMKGMTEQHMNLVTEWAAKSTAALRAGATTLYIPFLPANAIRDFQTAHVTSGLSPIDWVKGFAEGIKEGELFDEFMRSGGGQSGYFEARGARSTLNTMTRDPVTQFAMNVAKPWKAIQYVGEKIELAPRLGVFNRALHGPAKLTGAEPTPYGPAPSRLAYGKRGEGVTSDSRVASFLARNSTVDFARHGEAWRVVNQLVPFLNARWQGNINFYGSLKSNPPQTSAMRLGMVVGVPVLATHFWNKRFPKVMEDMAEYERDQNFVIVGGEEQDDQGRWTNVLKLPKGEVAPFATLLESYLDYRDKRPLKSNKKLALEVLSGLSPIPFEREGKLAPPRALGAVLPPALRAGVEGATNTNFYTGRQIVPEEYRQTGAAPEDQYPAGTPELFVQLSDMLGVSPMHLQNALVAQFGGIGRMMAYPAKAGTNIRNRFLGATGGAQQQHDFELRAESKLESGKVAMQEKRHIESAVKEIVDAPPQQRMDIVRQFIPKTPDEAMEFARRLKVGLEKRQAAIEHEQFARTLKTDAPEVRARTILKKLDELQTPEQRSEFLQSMLQNKILILEVMKEMQKLRPEAFQVPQQ